MAKELEGTDYLPARAGLARPTIPPNGSLFGAGPDFEVAGTGGKEAPPNAHGDCAVPGIVGVTSERADAVLSIPAAKPKGADVNPKDGFAPEEMGS